MTKVKEQNPEYRDNLFCQWIFNGEEDKVGDSREFTSVIHILNSLSFFPSVTKQRDPDTGQHSLLFQVRILN